MMTPLRRFNVYVTQPEVKPGCVLRRANIGLLEKKQLVTDHEVGRPVVLTLSCCAVRALSRASSLPSLCRLAMFHVCATVVMDTHGHMAVHLTFTLIHGRHPRQWEPSDVDMRR